MKAKFSVSEFTTWHQTFEQDVELYASLGVEYIEVCERKLPEDPRVARQTLEMIRRHGLKVSSFQPRCHALFADSMCPGIDDIEARAHRYRQSIDLVADVFPGEDIPLVAISGKAP